MHSRDRFDKFTERARKVLSLAQEEAQRLQHNYLGTEHLLLGLVREGEGVAAKVLANLGVELNRVREGVEAIIGQGTGASLGTIGLTPRAKKVIELAVDEARRLNHHYIGTEHLLLGLVREGEGIGAKVLESLGINLEKVRTQTIQVLSHVEVHRMDKTSTSEARAPQGPELEDADFTQLLNTLPLLSQVTNKKLDTFTVGILRVLRQAREEAQRFQHNYIGTEHLLLGLTDENRGVAAQVLENLGVELKKAHSAVEFIIGRRDRILLGEVGFTPRAKKVIALAIEEAGRMNHHYIGPEHLLLGMVREGEGIAAGVLESLGINLEKLRRETLRVLGQQGGIPSQRHYAPVVEAETTETAGQAGEKPAAAPITSDELAELRPGTPSVSLTQVNNENRFDDFTERARRVLSLAQEEAQRFQHNYIGTEHLLLGLVREGNGIAAKVLNSLDVELNKVRSAIEFIIGRGDQIVLGEIGLTPRAKKVVELAIGEAHRLHYQQIGTPHLLLGLVREGEGIAAGVLESLGVNLERVRMETIRALGQA